MIDSLYFKELIVDRLTELQTEKSRVESGSPRWRAIQGLMHINCAIFNEINFKMYGTKDDKELISNLVQ